MKPTLNQADGDIYCGGYDLLGYVQTIQLNSGEFTFVPYCVTAGDNERGMKFCQAFGPMENYGCILVADGNQICGVKQSAIHF